jgi:hypothetical protein
MVVTPAIRGLLGIEPADAGGTLRIAPSLPADWNRVAVRGVAAGKVRYDVTVEKAPGRMVVRVMERERSGSNAGQLIVAPAIPLDARIRGVTVNGATAKYQVTQSGDVQRVETVPQGSPGPRSSRGSPPDGTHPQTDVVFMYDEGTDVYVDRPDLGQGAASEGLRILRVRPDSRALRLIVEGRGERTYVVGVRTPRRLGTVDGIAISTPPSRDTQLRIRFDGPPDAYVRREIVLPFVGR